MVHLVNDIVRTRNVTALMIAHNINPLLPAIDLVIYIANQKVMVGKPEDILTSSSLTSLYGTPVEVLHDQKGNVAVIGVDEYQHHCDGGMHVI